MNMVRLGITNGSTLGELAESMDKIKAAAEEISTEQREELVNT